MDTTQFSKQAFYRVKRERKEIYIQYGETEFASSDFEQDVCSYLTNNSIQNMNHIKPGFLIKTYKQISVIWQGERGLETTDDTNRGGKKIFFPPFFLVTPGDVQQQNLLITFFLSTGLSVICIIFIFKVICCNKLIYLHCFIYILFSA